jgi:hypothetical protein
MMMTMSPRSLASIPTRSAPGCKSSGSRGRRGPHRSAEVPDFRPPRRRIFGSFAGVRALRRPMSRRPSRIDHLEARPVDHCPKGQLTDERGENTAAMITFDTCISDSNPAPKAVSGLFETVRLRTLESGPRPPRSSVRLLGGTAEARENAAKSVIVIFQFVSPRVAEGPGKVYSHWWMTVTVAVALSATPHRGMTGPSLTGKMARPPRWPARAPSRAVAESLSSFKPTGHGLIVSTGNLGTLAHPFPFGVTAPSFGGPAGRRLSS